MDPVRSRSSQTPSPSHSASASASSAVHHKRKFPGAPGPSAASAAAPFSLSDAGAVTSNDDLDSISAREEEDDDSDEEDDDDDEEDDDDDEEEEDNDSMRTFTTARLETPGGGAASGNPRSNKPPKPESNPIPKVEAPGSGAAEIGGKDGNAAQSGQQNAANAASLMPGIVVKEDTVKGIFTENIQTSGAYSAREEGLKREEDAGRLKFLCYANDGIDEHMIWLIGLKNIFARQLPNMPKEYIVRLVMDRSHKSMMVIRHNLVVGGITYRPYKSNLVFMERLI